MCFFFFQAEDGIRDFHVTGVQTCALPILALKTDATRLRTEASDEWAYYQAKGTKAAVQEAARSSWLAAGKEPPPEYQARIKRYEEEQKEIQAQAREKEREAEEKQREAEELL